MTKVLQQFRDRMDFKPRPVKVEFDDVSATVLVQNPGYRAGVLSLKFSPDAGTTACILMGHCVLGPTAIPGADLRGERPIEEQAFEWDDVAWGHIPALARQAIARIHIEGCAIHAVTVERQRIKDDSDFFSNDVKRVLAPPRMGPVRIEMLYMARSHRGVVVADPQARILSIDADD